MCTSPPNCEIFQEEQCTVNNPTSGGTNKRKVTYRDFTDVANSVTNLALSLPTEDARMECLGILVRMRYALSMSAGVQWESAPAFSVFMSSAEEFLSPLGPNADSRREGVFADHGNNFEMQRHNTGKVRHKRLTSCNERNARGAKSRKNQVLNEIPLNLHLSDARYRQAQCSYCGSHEHTIKRCSVMDKVACVGKKNSDSWNLWYRTLGNPSHHVVVMSSAGYTLKPKRELQQARHSASLSDYSPYVH